MKALYKIKIFFINLGRLFKKVFKWMIKECKDIKTLILFFIVMLVLSTPTWGGYLLSIITDNPWHLTYATATLAFWVAPFTPFLPLCLSIAIGLKKLIFKNHKTIKDNQIESNTIINH